MEAHAGNIIKKRLIPFPFPCSILSIRIFCSIPSCSPDQNYNSHTVKGFYTTNFIALWAPGLDQHKYQWLLVMHVTFKSGLPLYCVVPKKYSLSFVFSSGQSSLLKFYLKLHASTFSLRLCHLREPSPAWNFQWPSMEGVGMDIFLKPHILQSFIFTFSWLYVVLK